MAGGPSSGGQESTDEWWVVVLKIGALLVLTFLSATFSGLDLGLMSLSPTQLELLIKEGKDGGLLAQRNARRAKQILPIRRDGNLLLCTVLLGNVAVNSCMAVFLDSFTSGAFAFVITTLLVVTFGEIMPQSLCYKHSLLIGARLLPILKVFRILFYPVNKPVALILDSIFGDADHSSVVMTNNQMKAALDYQNNKKPGLLGRTESGFLKGALRANEYSVKDVMLPIEKVICLEAQAVIDAALLRAVSEVGFSKLPVIEYVHEVPESKRARVIGLLHVSDLLVINPASATTVKVLLEQFGKSVTTIDANESFLTLLGTMRQDKSQLTCVREAKGSQDPHWFHSGIVVAQDVLNAIAQEDLGHRPTSKETAKKRLSGFVEVGRGFSKTSGNLTGATTATTKMAWMDTANSKGANPLIT